MAVSAQIGRPAVQPYTVGVRILEDVPVSHVELNLSARARREEGVVAYSDTVDEELDGRILLGSDVCGSRRAHSGADIDRGSVLHHCTHRDVVRRRSKLGDKVDEVQVGVGQVLREVVGHWIDRDRNQELLAIRRNGLRIEWDQGRDERSHACSQNEWFDHRCRTIEASNVESGRRSDRIISSDHLGLYIQDPRSGREPDRRPELSGCLS